MRRKKEPERVEENVEDDVPYEFRDISTLAIPMDQQRGKWARPIVILTGGWYDTDKSIIPYKVDSTGRQDIIGVCPEHQADAFFQDTTPGDGTINPVLAETEYVRLISVAAQCKWTVQPTPLEIYLTLEGTTYTITKNNPVDSTWYYVYPDPNTNQTFFTNSTIGYNLSRAFLVEARSAQVDVELSGGTPTLLKCVVKYAKW